MILTVTVNGKTVTARGMIDSGNLLTDPIDGTPVIPVNRALLMPLLSPELRNLLEQSPMPLESLSGLAEAPRLRIIPANTATGKGMLLALRPERLTLTETEGKQTSQAVACLVCPIAMEDAPADALIPATLLL